MSSSTPAFHYKKKLFFVFRSMHTSRFLRLAFAMWYSLWNFLRARNILRIALYLSIYS